MGSFTHGPAGIYSKSSVPGRYSSEKENGSAVSTHMIDENSDSIQLLGVITSEKVACYTANFAAV